MNSETLKQRIIFRRIIQVFILVAVFLMAISNINAENDFFWQIRMGEQIVKFHNFPTRDIFSQPAYGAVWTLHEWIPSTIFYLIFTYWGSFWMVAFKAGILTVTFGLFLLLFNKLKINLYLSLIVLALAALVNTRGVWAVFPSIFEYFFVVVTLLLLEYYRSTAGKFIPFTLCLLSLVWVNSHGSFFALTVAVGAYLVGDIIAKFIKKKHPNYRPEGLFLSKKQQISLLIVFIVSLVTPFATPSGYWTFLYPFRISFGSFTPYVSEYQKFWTVWNWNWADFVHGFSLILFTLMILFFVISIKRLHPTDLILGFFFSLLVATAVRHTAVFVLVAAFIIVRYLRIYFGEYRGIFGRSLVKDLVVIFLIIFSVFYYKLRMVPFGTKLTEDGYPQSVAEIVNESGIGGNMFNHYNYGGYLIWKMPDYKVFIDGRLEMYEGKVGEDYKTILESGPGWEDLVYKKYKINFFIDYLKDPIIGRLMYDSKWKYIYHDNEFVLFVRNLPENEKLINEYWTDRKQSDFDLQYKTQVSKFLLDYFNTQGDNYVKARKFVDAMAAYQQATAVVPESIQAHLKLAEVYLVLQNGDDARNEFEAVLTLDPTNQEARQGLNELKEVTHKKEAPIW